MEIMPLELKLKVTETKLNYILSEIKKKLRANPFQERSRMLRAHLLKTFFFFFVNFSKMAVFQAKNLNFNVFDENFTIYNKGST